jgi:hypothetical protein
MSQHRGANQRPRLVAQRGGDPGCAAGAGHDDLPANGVRPAILAKERWRARAGDQQDLEPFSMDVD